MIHYIIIYDLFFTYIHQQMKISRNCYTKSIVFLDWLLWIIDRFSLFYTCLCRYHWVLHQFLTLFYSESSFYLAFFTLSNFMAFGWRMLVLYIPNYSINTAFNELHQHYTCSSANYGSLEIKKNEKQEPNCQCTNEQVIGVFRVTVFSKKGTVLLENVNYPIVEGSKKVRKEN